MDTQGLIDRLAGPGENEIAAAGEALVELGAAAVPPMLKVLCDEESPVDWITSSSILQRIGEPAFEPLIEAIASAATPEIARRAGSAFTKLRVPDVRIYLPALRHPDPRVRSDAAYAFRLQGAGALPYASDLIELLADPDEDVRRRAESALGNVGPEVVPMLLKVRRSTTAGRLRGPALRALAAIGGPDVLDEADRALIERLIGFKIPVETPAPMHVCGSWFAIPTLDQAAVLDAFELSRAAPVTMRLGGAAWNHDSHDWAPQGTHRRCARVYVSPSLKGWTLVFGMSAGDVHRIGPPGRDEYEDRLRATVRDRCAELSRGFGTAHWYGMSCGDNWTSWCLAEDGDVVRFYDIFAPREQIGSGHPAEDGYLLPHERGFPEDAFDGVDLSDHAAFRARHRQVKEELSIPDPCYAITIARRLSVDPSALGPHTRVEGHGVLALTACGIEHGSPPGALLI